MVKDSMVFSFPRFSWKKTLWCVLCFSGLFLLAASIYWFVAIRPFTWVSSAAVRASHRVIQSPCGGVFSWVGPSLGEEVSRGFPLFLIDPSSEEKKQSYQSLSEEIEQKKQQVDQAMQEYLQVIGSQEKATIHLNAFEKAQNDYQKAQERLRAFQKSPPLQEVQSPVRGVVVQAPQEIVSACLGQSLCRVLNLDDLWIEAKVPESLSGKLSLGAKVKVRLNAFPEKLWDGVISWIAPTTCSQIEGGHVDREEICVRIRLDSMDSAFKPGLSAQVRFATPN